MVNAQEWLDKNYPKDQRSGVKIMDVDNKNLESELDLSDFIDLEELNCSHNQLASLKLDNCKKLKKLICDHNQLRQLDLANLNYLKELICWNNYLQVLKLPSQTDQLIKIAMGENNFPSQDLSMFSHLVNLKSLGICNNNQEKVNHGIYNRFYGSLEPLQNLTKLEILDIRNTDINKGLEYLSSDNMRWLGCLANTRKDAKCKDIYLVISEDCEEFRKWKIANASLIEKAKRVDKLDWQLQQLSDFLLLSQPYDFTQLQQEITRLKYQELAPQVREEKIKIEQLIAKAKNKAGESFVHAIDLLLETQRQINQTTEVSQRDKLSIKIEAYQNILLRHLTEEELQALLTKQKEVCELEKHLASLQQNQEQVVQIQQNQPFKK